LKRALLRGLPDGLAERMLSVAGYFLFAVGRKEAPEC
jgi:hypothetical protein